jgi:outer membrane protein assembly factor BamE (lipoprotein component of BamABCDE complex)
VFLLTLITLSGCVGHYAMASRLNRISIGMAKAEVVEALGNPATVSAREGVEDLTYVLNASAWDTAMPEPYIVRIVDGKVQSYGRKADMPAIAQP